MKKLLQWHDAYTLKILVCLLILVTALYPKLPSIHIVRTWVYIRLEDFLILTTVLVWFVQLIRHKVAFPKWIGGAIGGYWAIGLISMICSFFFIMPQLSGVFPHLAALSFLRRIEYMVLFFVSFSTIRSVKDVRDYIIILSITVFGVIIYGLGQRYYLHLWAAYPKFFEQYSFCFPSFQTGNEEFAKGIPLCLPPGGRITSTFGGHYDLAAYLVLVLPIFLALIFSVKRLIWKFGSFILFLSGLVLLILTASRVSFGAYIVGVVATLIFYKKKWFIIPVLLISAVVLLSFSDSTAKRFLSTIRISSIVTDSQGQLIGESSTELPNELRKKLAKNSSALQNQSLQNLPQGSSFIGLPQRKKSSATNSAVVKKTLTPEETRRLQLADGTLQLSNVSGNFTVRQALVYDISFTTRFQSEWPNAWGAFLRNPFLGSGYSTITLATDNDYLRALGETGALGLAVFIFIFIILGITLASLLPHVKSPLVRGVAVGLAGGALGLAGNAVLIDVYEASKVAENLWLLLGIAVGGLFISTKQKIAYWPTVKKVMLSNFFLGVYLLLILLTVFGQSVTNFFVADDFTWLYWAATASLSDIVGYFTNAQNFFYRPLDKTLVVFLYNILAFQPEGYHIFGLFLHFLAAIGVYLVTLKLLKKKLLAFLTSLIFIIHPAQAEAVYWISTLSIKLSTVFILYAVNAFINFRNQHSWRATISYFAALVLSVLAFLSYEIAVVIPFFVIAIDLCILRPRKSVKAYLAYLPFIALLPLYYVVRVVTHAFNGGGDYSYSMTNFIPNVIGNFTGYVGLFVSGHSFFPIYDGLRANLRDNVLLFTVIVGITSVVLVALGYVFRKYIRAYITSTLGRMVVFGVLFGFLSLLPFLPLGNIAERYLYLATFGFSLSLIAFLYSIVLAFTSHDQKKTGIILGIIVFVLGIFSYSEQAQQNAKWHKAGEITKGTLALFRTDYPALTPVSHVYFINAPVKYDGVWVFPVGLKHGLWFIYGDQLPAIYQVGSQREVFDFIHDTEIQQNYIFEYDKAGKITEVKQ